MSTIYCSESKCRRVSHGRRTNTGKPLCDRCTTQSDPVVIYKLLNPDRTSHGGYPWTLKKWKQTPGEGRLCGPGWLHSYTHPLLAALLNPIHANLHNPVLYRGEGRGRHLDDHGLQVGYTEMRICEPMDLPMLTREQRIRFGIACAVSVSWSPSFLSWAQGWVDGTDRAVKAAEAAARAAWGAARAAAEAARAAEAAAEAAWGAAWAAWAAARAAAEAAWAAARAAAVPLDLIACAEWAVSESTTLPT